MNFSTTDGLIQLNGLSVKINSDNLFDVQKASENAAQPSAITLTPLSEEETANLLSNLPKQVQPPPPPEFSWREGPTLPLQTELKKFEDWQPAQSPKAPEAPIALEPLKVLSATPNGKISKVNRIQIRFSQDMYALGEQAKKLSEKQIRIKPKVKGDFTWLDTRTLRFEAQPGFALATHYTVKVDTSLKARSGNQLSVPYQFNFKTPALKLNRHFPDNQPSVSQTPIVLLNFSTPVDPMSLLEHTYLKHQTNDPSKSQKTIKFRLATEKDFLADPLFTKQHPRTSVVNSIAIVPLQVLQKGASYRVHLLAGIKPKEGDIHSEDAINFSITVEKNLAFAKITCGYSDDQLCLPQDVIIAEFNNVLLNDFEDNSQKTLPKGRPFSDFSSDDTPSAKGMSKTDKRIQISPTIEGMRIQVVDNKIFIYGNKKPNTRYSVSVHGTITDIFGNKLSETNTSKVTTSINDYWGESIVAESFVVIPGYARPLYAFFTNRVENVSIQIYKVKPEDFNQYFNFADGFYKKHEGYLQSHASINENKGNKQPPGELVYESSLVIDNPLEFTVHALKLDDAFEKDIDGNSTGHAVVVLRADKPRKNHSLPEGKLIWIQKTNIGLSSINDLSKGVVLASDLATGKPLIDVKIQVYNQDNQANTDEKGIANLNRKQYRDSLAIIASKGKDTALLPWNGSNLWAHKRGKRLLWYVVDDRNLYRPGEKVSVKGWFRNYTSKDNGQLSLLKANNKTIKYVITDAENQEIGKGKTKVTDLNGFDIEFNLPQETNLGNFTIKLNLFGSSDEHYHYFKVEEFRRPEFDVLIEAGRASGSAPQKIPHAGTSMVGQTVNFNLTAKYFAGGSLASAPVEWHVWANKGYFAPPNRKDYFFGQQQPWWYFSRHPGEYYPETFSPSNHSLQSQTDNNGEAHLSFELSSINSNSPMVLELQGSVSDVNRQTFSGASSALIHPASQYVGIKTKSQFYNLGEALKVESIVADLTGKLLSDQPINIKISAYNSHNTESKPIVCQLVSSKQARSCETKMETSGIYSIEASTQDKQGRTHLARQYIWVAGAELPGNNLDKSLDNQEIQLIGKTENLHEGDELRIMLQTPFAPAHVMISILREGFIENRIIAMKTTTELIRINLDQRHSPGFELRVHAVGGGDKPSYATGSQGYEVTPDSEIFDLKVSTVNKIVSPGSEVELSVRATNSQGAVANAEVVIFVVDEAVLAAADYRIPDPLEVFQQFRGAGVSTDELREHIKIPPTPKELEELGIRMDEMVASRSMDLKYDKSAESAFAPSAQAGKSEITVRKNFSALALFSPRVQTNRRGEAKIKFTLPDSLTRYRITAIAAKDGNQFAYGENNVTAQLSLMVRPMPPRFSHVGDRFELPVVIQNVSDQSIQTDISLRTQNLPSENAASKKHPGFNVKVPANDRVEVHFPVKPNSPGMASGDVIIRGDDHFDAAHFSFPVWTPLVQESEAIYGEITEGVHSYPVNFPQKVVSNFGGISIQTSSSALNTLGNAYVYLRDYPYSCTEQIASRVLATSVLGNLLDHLDVTKNGSKAERLSQLKRDVKVLLSRQKHNGSFGFWSQQAVESSYASIHVIHALFYAKTLNINVDPNQLQKGLDYLENIENNINEHYSQQAKLVIRSYALYVASLFGDRPANQSPLADKARKLFAEMKPELETQSLAATAWLLSALPKQNDFNHMREELIRHIANHTDQTTHSAQVGRVYTRDGYTHMASTRKNDALVLSALIEQDTGSELISQFMRGLMEKRIKGRWYNTQENVFVLLAALKYFHQFEKTNPNFVASTWLGQNFAGSARFKQRTTVTKELMIPERLVESGEQTLTISKKGQGRLYYRIGIDYALDTEQLDGRSQGFTVTRHFESAEDDKNAVKKSGGIWHIKAGTLVRVTLTMKVPGQRYYVALVDPFAAGLEALSPSLANTASQPHTNSMSSDQWQYFWSRNWFTHQNLRDERAEAFADQLWAGKFKYSYLARATTLGRFIVAPARAEEMYNPETFGRSASDIVIVE